MGGSDASRGFVYQGFVSVLEALTDGNAWDKIYVEYPTKGDKVDIALERQNRLIKCIQVKSTVNIFTKSNVQKWLRDLISDAESPAYELFLIGHCDKAANVFIKSVKKYYEQKTDQEMEKSLKGFDMGLLDHREVKIDAIPFDKNRFQQIVRDSLHRYISTKGQMMLFDQIDFIAAAIENDHMISSTDGKGIARNEFEERLEKRIRLVADQYAPKRTAIWINSYPDDVDEAGKTSGRYLSFTDKFQGRNLKAEYDWNRDIYGEIKEFLRSRVNREQAYELYMAAHCSIAFAAGRLLNSKSGINIFPMQKTAINGIELWNIKPFSGREYSEWEIRQEVYQENQSDSALVLNVTRDIYNEVVQYMDEANLQIGRIVNCILPVHGATNFSIADGTHAMLLANQIYKAIAGRRIDERRATLHIFASAPNGFMFFLGQNSMGFGKCQLYEYDLEKRSTCTYKPSIRFID